MRVKVARVYLLSWLFLGRGSTSTLPGNEEVSPVPWLAYKRAMNPAVYVGLFMLGAAIAAALPRPLQEDRRASNEFRRQKHKTVSSSSAKNNKSGGRKNSASKRR